jgi:hypothetical protein
VATLNVNTNRGIPGLSFKVVEAFLFKDYYKALKEDNLNEAYGNDISLLVIYSPDGLLKEPTVTYSTDITESYRDFGMKLILKGYNHAPLEKIGKE